jgi:hypothetical protein
MANVDAPFGLRPVRHLNGNPWNGQTVRMLIEDDDDTSYFIGDPVTITGAAGSDDTSGIIVADIAVATHSNRIYGVIVSFEPNPDNLSRFYIPTLQGGYANVCIDPDVIYEVRDDGTAALDGGSIGTNAMLTADTAGSTITGLSGWELDASIVGASATYQLQILGISQSPDNALGIHCVWDVIISQHILRTVVAGSGFLGI